VNEDPPPQADRAEDTQELPTAQVIGRVGVDRRLGPPPPGRPRRRFFRGPSGVGCIILFVAGLALGAAVALLFIRHRQPPRLSPPPPPPPRPASAPAPRGPRLVFAPTNVRPEATPEIIEAGQPQVYCFFDVPEAPPSAVATLRWTGATGESADTGAEVVKESADHLRGSGALKPPKGQPVFAEGIYEAELLVDGRKAVDGSFAALKGGAALLEPPKGMERYRPEITDLVVAAGTPPAQTQKPFVLPASPPKVLVTFKYAYALPGAAFTVCWLYEDGLIRQATTEITIRKDAGSAQAWFAPKPPQKLPAGKYAVIISLGEDTPPLAQESFWVGRRPRPDELAAPQQPPTKPPPRRERPAPPHTRPW
jgi:hypothetical protein